MLSWTGTSCCLINPTVAVLTLASTWAVKNFGPLVQVRLRCQKGIPPALRGRTWLYLSGGKVKKEQNQGKFQVSQASLSVLLFSFLIPCASGYPSAFRCHFHATLDSWCVRLSTRCNLFKLYPWLQFTECPLCVLTGAGWSVRGSQMGWCDWERPASTVSFSRNVRVTRRTRVGVYCVVPQISAVRS